jgi:peptide/nickel transport system substrate-binding protein
MLTKWPLPSRRALAVTAAALAAAGLAACSSSSSTGSGATGGNGSSSSAATGGNQPALVMESSPENSITRNFNPYAVTTPVYGMGPDGLIYEPLIQFNLAKPPENYPYLATKYTWSADGKSITFDIRQGVKWNDGQALTPDDVVFTYNLLKANKAINLAGLQINSVSASGSQVTVTFPSSQFMNLENVAGVAILPKHIWSSVGDPSTYVDSKAVGTGPYVVSNFNSQGITLTANPSYWQPVPVKKVFFPVYTSNTGATNALFGGQIDWTGNFIPGLKENFVNKDPAHNGYWMAANATNALFPNLNKWPTNQLAVRQAISAAIDRAAIGTQGEAGLEAPASNATGLTLPTFSAWSGPVASMGLKTTADPASAQQILTRAGYKKDGAGFYALNGKEVKLTLVDPAPYTDYAQSCQIIAQQLKAVGINATFSGLTVDAWNAAVASGNFDMTIHWGNGGITPYNLYSNWLDSRLATGNNATGDYERLNDPKVNAMLDKLNGDQTVQQQTADLAPIMQYVAANLPVIPTVNSAAWFERSSAHFTGWPSEDNPYDSGQPSGSNNGPGTGSDEVVILHLKPVSK